MSAEAAAEAYAALQQDVQDMGFESWYEFCSNEMDYSTQFYRLYLRCREGNEWSGSVFPIGERTPKALAVCMSHTYETQKPDIQAAAEMIRDLETIRYSTNPYNINRMTLAAGMACLEHDEYNIRNCAAIAKTRDRTREALKKMGFEVTRSSANFLFARHPLISGEELYRRLKENGILVRHFGAERIRDYNRISIGTEEQMDTMLRVTEKILKDVREAGEERK
jgi:hypothetical protein